VQSSRTSPGRTRFARRALENRALSVLAMSSVAASFLLAGCSSGSAPKASSSAGSASSDCVKQASTAVQSELKAGGSDPYPTEKVDASIAKGKTYYLVMLSAQIPAIADMGKGFSAAADAVGAKARLFDGRGTPDGAAQGVNSAIAAKADGIVLVSIDPGLVSQPLADAKAAGIPVVEGFTGDPHKTLLNGVVGTATPNNIEVGTLQAQYAASITNCHVNAATVASQSSKPSAASTKGVIAELQTLCADTCKTQVVDIAPADIATKLVGLLQTTFQRNPDINVITAASDTYVPYIVQALAAVNRNIPVIGGSGTQIAIGQKGGPMVADVLYPPTIVVGWYFFDSILRGASGKTGFADEFPHALVDKSNWGTNPDPLVLQSRFADYKQKFLALWGSA
jgi:ABC-type sugar transport system substrate-binding protein